MKKILSILVAIGTLFTILVPSFAKEKQWDLDKKPDFSDYVLNDYWYLDPTDTFVMEVGETDLTQGEIKTLSEKILAPIENIEFIPGDYTRYKTEDELILAYFVKSDWKIDNSTDIIHLYITDKGICYEVWERKNNETHCAFVECSTETIVEEIRNVMSDIVEGVEAKRAEADTEQKEEVYENEILLDSFERYAYVKAKGADLYGKFDSKVSVDFEAGICSYQTVEKNMPEYAFYFSLGEEADKYYICTEPDGNQAHYTDKCVYKISNGEKQGEYCIYDGENTTPKFETEIVVNENGILEEIRVLIKHSGFEGIIKSDKLVQSGVFNTFGSIKIETDNSESSSADESQKKADDAEQTESLLPAETENPVNKDDNSKEEIVKQEEKTEVKETEKEKETEEQEKTEELSEKVTYAEALNMLGLFKGTGNGFELDSNLTRAQGAAMLVRLLGKESVALKREPKGIFSDVDAENWAAPYVEYCFDNLITKGVGDNKYSPDAPLSGSQYVALVLRTLGYIDSEPENAEAVAYGCKLLSAEEAYSIVKSDVIDRNVMVYVSFRALSTEMKNGGTHIEFLVKNKSVDEKTARQLGLIE